MTDPHQGLLDVADTIDEVAHTVGDAGEWDQREALKALAKVRALRLTVDERLRAVELETAQEAFRQEARWGDIARAVGVTRQTAQATYRDRENKPRKQPHRSEPQPLPNRARRPSARDTNSWAAAMAGVEPD